MGAWLGNREMSITTAALWLRQNVENYDRPMREPHVGHCLSTFSSMTPKMQVQSRGLPQRPIWYKLLVKRVIKHVSFAHGRQIHIKNTECLIDAVMVNFRWCFANECTGFFH